MSCRRGLNTGTRRQQITGGSRKFYIRCRAAAAVRIAEDTELITVEKRA